MINLNESMGLGWDQTPDPWISSLTRPGSHVGKCVLEHETFPPLLSTGSTGKHFPSHVVKLGGTSTKQQG